MSDDPKHPALDSTQPPADAVAALVEALRRDEKHQNVPTGSLRRLAKMARAAASTSIGLLGGKIHGRADEGLGALDIKRVERLVSSLGELKGLAMKAGQMLGYLDPTMPDEVRKILALLQTQSQPMAATVLHAVLHEDLGQQRAEALLSGLDPTPVSVASIGQVHRARLPNGTDVAVKVLHPGMAEAIRADFRAARIGPAVTRLFVPGGANTVRGFMAEARARMLEECDYELEAEHQQTFWGLLGDEPNLIVPKVHTRWSTARVLTTTWEPGLGLDAFLAAHPSQESKNHFGRILFSFYFGTLYRSGWFHADPHPGNYAFCPDGHLVLYDFGCVRKFDRPTVAGFVGLARAVAQDDEDAVDNALRTLGARPPKNKKDRQVIRSLLRGFYGPLLQPGARPIDARISGEARKIMRSKMALMRIRLPAKFLFLFRIRFGLYAVLSRLGAVCDWRTLELELAQDSFFT
jgi:predicted unusual protein kinase regulating ubiquinone biosynthesis (AarF/ABC1/UbiB family)